MKREIIQRPPGTPFRENLWILPPHVQEQLPFTLCSAGITLRDPAYRIHRREGAHYYVLECILAGEGRLDVAGHHVRPRAGDVYLLPAEIPNQYSTDRANPWEKIWFNIQGEFVDALVACYHLDGVIYLPGANLQEMFRQGLALVRDCPPGTPVEFAAQLTRIFAAIAGIRAKSPPDTPAMQLAQELRDYLDTHWRRPYSLAALAEGAAKSPAQVMRVFTAAWKCTPKAYHTRLRLDAASRYLANTDEQIRIIADWLGFANEFQFSAWFRKHTSLAPRHYRQRSREK